jgi:hypothetical protein
MKVAAGIAVLCVALAACGRDAVEETGMLSLDEASRFAALATECITQEYPNKLGQVLRSDADLKPPRELHPAFHGCFDWHSAVHGHWMLVKLLKEYPDLPDRDEIAAAVYTSLDPANVAGEIAYFETASKSWERTYGWAWLLQLATELHTWDDPLGRELAANLEPLATVVRDRFIEFLPRQEYPVRTGVHPNTAFGLSFAWDYGDAVGDDELRTVVMDAANRYYAGDSGCPLGWEPSGEDFLSPCFEEAAIMARVLPVAEYRRWLRAFLPELSDIDSLVPANVSDRSDPKIVHLDGLNLSRAWNLFVIANHTEDREAAENLRAKADEHLAASLPHITSEHYEGSHWLGSFAVYALTRRR